MGKKDKSITENKERGCPRFFFLIIFLKLAKIEISTRKNERVVVYLIRIALVGGVYPFGDNGGGFHGK